MDLKGWTYLLTFADDLDVYGKGHDRLVVDRSSGNVVVRYKVKGVDTTPLGRLVLVPNENTVAGIIE